MARLPTVDLWKKDGSRIRVNRDEKETWIRDGWRLKPLRIARPKSASNPMNPDKNPERTGETDKNPERTGETDKKPKKPVETGN